MNLLTTDANTIIGQGAGDTVTGTNATLNNTDIIIDAVADDGDVLTITATDDILAANAATVVGFETVNYTAQAFVAAGAGPGTNTTFDVDSSGVTADNIVLDMDQNGTSILSASITGVATGTTVTASDDFTTAVTVDGDDNAVVIVNAAAATITAEAATNALAGATLNSSIVGSSTLVTDTDGAAVLTTIAGDMTITAVAATSVTATSSGSIDANTTDIGAATSVNLTATDEIDVGLDAATSATLSAGGTTASTVEDGAGDTLTTLSLSGNGTAHTFDVRTAEGVNNVTVTGTQDVTVGFDLLDVAALATALTVTDSSTGTSTVVLDTADAGSATDLSGVAADVINLGVANTQVLTFASGAAVTVSANQATGTYDGADATAATNTLAITLNDGDDTNGTGVSLSGVTLTDIASVTIDASVDDGASTITSLTASADNTDVTIEASAIGVTLATAVDLGTGDLVINSTGAVGGTGAAITANSLTATGSGAVTLDSIDASTLATVTTGSGNDALTVSATGASLTLDAGAGTNIVTLAAGTNAFTYALSAGTGFDTLRLVDGQSYSAGTLTASGFDRIGFDEAGTNGTTAVTVANSLLDGQSYILNTDEVGVVTITVALGTGEVSADLSSLTFDNTLQAADDGFLIDQSAATANVTLTGSSLINDLRGGTGNDVLTGGAANDVLNAGTAGTDSVSGGAGDDAITTAGGADTIDGGAGADTISSGAGVDVITGGEGADDITASTGGDTITLTETTAAGDAVRYVAAADYSAVGATAGTFTDFDVITGFGTGDALSFDDGDATIAPVFSGNQLFIAGTVAGTSVSDLTVTEATDVDQVTLFLNDAAVLAQLTAGVDVVAVTFGTSSAVYAVGDSTGGIAAIDISLIATVDAVLAAGDIATIDGGTGSNTLVGSDLADVITGGAGADVLTGGDGADTFVFAAGVADTVAAATSVAGIDQILDLVVNGAAADLIDLTVTVAAVNTAVATGTANEATFITDINTLLNVGGGVGFDTAVAADISAALVTLNAGDQTGKTFLAVDLDADDAFTAADFIVDVTGITATLLDTNVFV